MWNLLFNKWLEIYIINHQILKIYYHLSQTLCKTRIRDPGNKVDLWRISFFGWVTRINSPSICRKVPWSESLGYYRNLIKKGPYPWAIL